MRLSILSRSAPNESNPGPTFQDSPIDQNNFGRNNMVGGCSVNRDVRAGGIVGDHSAEGRTRTGRHIRAETKSVRLEKRIQLIEHDTRASTHGAFFHIEIGDLPVVARKIDNQAFADGVSDQTGARAARRDGNIRIRPCADHGARLLRAARESYADRFDLVNRRIGGEELSRQIIEPDVATRGGEYLSLCGSHCNAKTGNLNLPRRQVDGRRNAFASRASERHFKAEGPQAGRATSLR